MDKKEFAARLSDELKLIRTEYGLTQEEMAAILGVSKKTLVETEKNRRRLSWTESAALAAIFAQSRVLQNALGGDPTDMLAALAFAGAPPHYPATLGGKVWWRQVLQFQGYTIQQNLISQHFRLLNSENQRLYSSFRYDDIVGYLTTLTANKKEEI